MTRAGKRRRTLRTWLFILAGSLVGLGIAACILLWLLVAHVPTWYRPPHVPEADHQRVRDSLVAGVSQFSDHLVAAEPFVFALDDRTVSEWIDIRSMVWPDSAQWLPPFLHDAVVSFQPGKVVLAARLEKDGWQAIVSAHLTFEVTPHYVFVWLKKVAGGSLPVPVGAMADPLQALLAASDPDVNAMPDLMADAARFLRNTDAVETLKNGVAIENRFRWENGKRWFRIVEIEIDTGRLRLRIEPLPTKS